MASKKEILQHIMSMSDSEVWQPYEFQYFGPSTRCLSFFSEVNKESAHVLISQILQLEEDDPDESITIYLNTTGGSITDGLAIYDVLTDCSCPVLIYATGLCASAGLIILSAGDYRYASKSCTFYYHQPVMEDASVNNLKDMEELQKYYLYSKEKMDGIIKSRTKMKRGIWNKNFEGKTSYYFSSREAIDFNLIDKIGESRKIEFTIEKD